jgi:hypothetical protein
LAVPYKTRANPPLPARPGRRDMPAAGSRRRFYAAFRRMIALRRAVRSLLGGASAIG